MLLHDKEKTCAGRRCRRTDCPSGQWPLCILHSFGLWSGQRIQPTPSSAWEKVNGTIVRTVRVKGSSTCLAKHFQDVMEFRGDNRDIHCLAKLLRKMNRGRLCCLKAVRMAKWAPTQDGPDTHRIIAVEEVSVVHG